MTFTGEKILLFRDNSLTADIQTLRSEVQFRNCDARRCMVISGVSMQEQQKEQGASGQQKLRNSEQLPQMASML
ncbi:hypothetical protein GN956_G10385 [Arapaima gigas]